MFLGCILHCSLEYRLFLKLIFERSIFQTFSCAPDYHATLIFVYSSEYAYAILIENTLYCPNAGPKSFISFVSLSHFFVHPMAMLGGIHHDRFYAVAS